MLSRKAAVGSQSRRAQRSGGEAAACRRSPVAPARGRFALVEGEFAPTKSMRENTSVASFQPLAHAT